jgi:1-acyl-sn-glycerol-3-phosphate acyltransferase
MVGGRQQIILEFFEKFLAALAAGSGAPGAFLAVFALVRRREIEAPAESWRREVCVLFAYLAGAYLCPLLAAAEVDPNHQFGLGWVGSLALGWSGRRVAGRMRWDGKQFRNLAAFFVLGLACTALARQASDKEIVEFLLAALFGSLVHVPFVKRNGELGLLAPGAWLLWAGAQFSLTLVAGVGFGAMLPAAYLLVQRLGAGWLARGLACTAGAGLAGMAPAWAAPAGFAVLLVMSLETWRFALRWAVLALLMILYRFRIYGEQNIPYAGPAVLIGNHVSLLDGFLIAAHCQRFARFLVYDAYFKNPVMRFGLNLFRTIPIAQGARREMVESLREARRRIEEGHVAGIFPEGSVTRSGFLNPFQKGITRVAQGAALPIIPAYMNGLWMSLVSFSEGAFQLRLPRLHRDLEIEYGEPIASSASHAELWARVKALEVKAAFRDSSNAEVLPLAFLRGARRFARQTAVRTKTATVSYRELAITSLLWARYLSRRWGSRRRVAVLLPEGEDRVVAYAALAIAGQTALEFPRDAATSEAEFAGYLQTQRIGHVITSKEELAARGIRENEGIVLVSKLKGSVSTRRALKMKLIWYLSPKAAWRRSTSQRIRKDSVAMLAHQGGALVPLSYRGLQAAAHAIRRNLWMKPGVFVRCKASWESSATFLLGMWTPILNGAAIACDEGAVKFEIQNATALDAQTAAEHILAVETGGATAALDPRFLPVVECAEMSGVAALSSPEVTVASDTQGGVREGIAGRLLFGVEAKQEGGKTWLRSPQRCLSVDGEARPGDWVATGLDGVGDFGALERAAISSTRTS